VGARPLTEPADVALPRTVRIAWLSYLDPYAFSGGGELNVRALLATGRARGHRISETSFLRSRPQRLLRRTHLHRGVKVDWAADLFVLSNIRNGSQRSLPFPSRVLARVLETGRTAIHQEAYVDVCTLDMPCGGDPSRCPFSCDRSWSRRLFDRAQIAIFNSPMQQRMINSVLDNSVPGRQVLSPPSIDVDRFKPLGLDRDIDVLYVGALKQSKGYYNLLERFGAERMTFVGPNGLGEPVSGTYLGAMDQEQLPQIYNRARTFAHLPAWHEPMGRTVVEAALCGCDIITNDRVGVTTYPRPVWTHPSVVRGNATRFWESLEAAVDWTG
jgi:glycosyltransferase involved in cell wall biosynthesis